jgi:tetratricopeptide (TPR) repeat protein
MNMTKLQKLCTLLILLSLISCDDQASKPATTAQDFPQFDSFQTPSEIDQLKARLFDNPEDFEALSTLGDRYFEAARYLEAIQTYDKSLVVNPMCADCLNDRGLAQYYIGDPKSALESFDKAIEVDPQYVHVWLSKGYVLFSVGRYEEAIPVLNKVKELDTTGGLAAEADKFIAQAVERNYQ